MYPRYAMDAATGNVPSCVAFIIILDIPASYYFSRTHANQPHQGPPTRVVLADGVSIYSKCWHVPRFRDTSKRLGLSLCNNSKRADLTMHAFVMCLQTTTIVKAKHCSQRRTGIAVLTPDSNPSPRQATRTVS